VALPGRIQPTMQPPDSSAPSLPLHTMLVPAKTPGTLLASRRRHGWTLTKLELAFDVRETMKTCAQKDARCGTCTISVNSAPISTACTEHRVRGPMLLRASTQKSSPWSARLTSKPHLNSDHSGRGEDRFNHNITGHRLGTPGLAEPWSLLAIVGA
jgi:hypothetical protein